ncbi:MAG: ATP-binding cassette domain-containing protein [Propioniciclava sp.]
MSLLQIRDLSISFGRRTSPAVDRLSLDIAPSQRLGLIGESGSGKTVTALAVMGLLPDSAKVTGSIVLQGRELVGLSDAAFSRVRGDSVTMIFQEPMTALDPTMTTGRQVAEVFRLHRGADAGRAREAVVVMLAEVGLPEPERVADSYPHQLSGGQRQRVVTAMALINGPALVLCDEPTTALDVTVQATVLRLLDRVLTESGSACLFISHDLAVVSQLCSSVVVLRDGVAVESGLTEQVLTAPRDPYTAGLVATARIDAVPPGSRLPTVADFLGGIR